MYAVFLLPALISMVADPIPGALEVHRGTWVLRGVPDAATIAAMKRARITHVFSLCRDGDPGFDPNQEGQALADAGILFSRVSLKRAPTAADLELFRMVRNSLPPDAKVLVHCTDGNRAAAVAVAFLAIEGRVKRAEALDLARRAGMVQPETENALRVYLKLGG